jgi:hypothetical protein
MDITICPNQCYYSRTSYYMCEVIICVYEQTNSTLCKNKTKNIMTDSNLARFDNCFLSGNVVKLIIFVSVWSDKLIS